MKNNFKKNLIYNIIGSTFYSFTSLFFLIVVTRINGISNAGVFTFAFSFACLLVCIGNYATRTFQVTDKSDMITDADYIYQRFITTFVMVIVAIIYSFISGYDFNKFIIILLLVIYKVLESFSEVLFAIMQKHNELYKVGISFFLKAVLGFGIFLITNLLTSNLIFSILFLNLSTILVILLYDLNILKLYKFILGSLNRSNVLSLFKLGFHPFLFTFLTLYIMNAQRYVIDINLSNDFQTIFGIIIMPATIMMIASQFLVQPFLVSLKELINSNDISKFKFLVLKICMSIIFIGLIGIILSWLIGIPILEFVYDVPLSEYKYDLVYILIAATAFGCSYIISAALTTLRKVRSQSVIFIVASFFTYIISNILIIEKGIYGASISYLLSMIFLLVLYVIVFSIVLYNESKK